MIRVSENIFLNFGNERQKAMIDWKMKKQYFDIDELDGFGIERRNGEYRIGRCRKLVC